MAARRRFPAPPFPVLVGLVLAVLGFALLLVWSVRRGASVGGAPAGESTAGARAPGEVPRMEAVLPVARGPVTAFDRSVALTLLRERPPTTPLRGAVRVELDDVAWNDERGRPFVRAARVTGRLDAQQVVRGNVVVSDVDGVRPRVWLYRAAGDTLFNYQHVLAAWLAPPQGTPPSRAGSERLVEVLGLTVHDGFASILEPATARQAAFETRLTGIQAGMPRMVFSAPQLPAPLVQVAQAKLTFERPDVGWQLPLVIGGSTVTFPGGVTRFAIDRVAFGESRLTDVVGVYDARQPGLGVRANGLAPFFRLADVTTFAPKRELTGEGSFHWVIAPTPDNGVRVALDSLRFAADGSNVAGAATFTALGDVAKPALVSANLRLAPLKVATLERLSGRKLPYTGELTGRLSGEHGRIRLDATARLATQGAPPFSVVVSGAARSAATGLTLDQAVARFSAVPLAVLRSVVPVLPLRGTVSGQVSLSGAPDRAPLELHARFDVAGGVALLGGTLSIAGPRPAYDLTGRLLGVRPRDVVAANLPPVRLTAGVAVRGAGYQPGSAVADFQLNGHFTGWSAGPDDRVRMRGSLSAGVLRLDTLEAQLASARLEGAGAWPLAAPGSGAVTYALDVSNLSLFAPYLPGRIGPARGTARLAGTMSGRTAALRVAGRLTVRHLRLSGWRAGDAAAGYAVQLGGVLPQLSLDLQARGITTPSGDSLTALTATARLTSPQLAVAVRAQRAGGGLLALAASGDVPPTGPRLVTLESFRADLGTHRWQLLRPARLSWLPGDTVAVRDLLVQEEGGPGRLELSGTLLPAAAADYTLAATAIPVGELYALIGTRPAPVTGLLDATARVHGPAAAPVVTGSFSLDSGSVAGVPLARLQGAASYRGARLTAFARAELGQGGLITARADLPLAFTLGLPPQAHLLAAGEVQGSLTADTVPLAPLASLTPQISRAGGVFSARATLSGSAQAPVLAGAATLRGGTLTLAATGQQYSDIDGGVTLSDRRILVDSLRVRSGGTALVRGTIAFPELRHPTAELAVRFDGFRPLATAPAPQAGVWGDLGVSGSLAVPVVRGRVRLDEGNLLMPAAGGGDITGEAAALGVEELAGPAVAEQPVPVTPFMDRVLLDGVKVEAGPNLWFVTQEARVQLSGTLTVDKAEGTGVRVTGTLGGQRGYFTVAAGPIVRRLDLARARIRFLGTSELNPEIDATATRTVLDPQGNTMDIQARLTGTLDNPQLALSTAEGVQIPESELLSFLVFGEPSFALGTGVGQALLQQTLFGGLTDIASMQLQQGLSASGLPVDIFEIQPSARNGLIPGSVVVGREVAPNVFLTVQTAVGVLFGNAGQPAGTPVAARIDWQLSPRLSAMLGFEPVNPTEALHGFFAVPTALTAQDQFTVELRRRWTY